MSKQDRSYARTAADLERKLNFGKSFAEVMELANDSKRIATEASEAVKDLDEKMDQEEIFNRLTKNGEVQGIYRDEEGNIYILAELLKAGIIKSVIENMEINLDEGFVKVRDIDNNGGFLYFRDGLVYMSDMNGVKRAYIGQAIQAGDGEYDYAVSVRSANDRSFGIHGSSEDVHCDAPEYDDPDRGGIIYPIRWAISHGVVYLTTDSSSSKLLEDAFLPLSEVADYVVEQGAIGVWTYRKWNSGIAECWGKIEGENIETSAWGNVYAGDHAIPATAYPFVFVSEPVVTCNYAKTGDAGDGWLYSGEPGTASTSPSFGFARATAGTVQVHGWLHAIGWWK